MIQTLGSTRLFGLGIVDMADQDNKLNPFIRAVRNLPFNYGEARLIEYAGDKTSQLGRKIVNPKLLPEPPPGSARIHEFNADGQLVPKRFVQARPPAVRMLGRGLQGLGRIASVIGKGGRTPLGLLTTGLAEIGYDAFNDWNYNQQHPYAGQGKYKKEYEAEQQGLKVDYETGKVFDPKTGQFMGFIKDPWDQNKTIYTPKRMRNQKQIDKYYGKPYAGINPYTGLPDEI